MVLWILQRLTASLPYVLADLDPTPKYYVIFIHCRDESNTHTSSEVCLATSTSDGSSLELPAPDLIAPLLVEDCISSLVNSASRSCEFVIVSISPRLRSSRASTSLLITASVLFACSIYKHRHSIIAACYTTTRTIMYVLYCYLPLLSE